MSVPRWNPAVNLSPAEEKIMARLTRVKKLFGFLRQYRHVIFDEKLWIELSGMYRSSGAGKTPKPPEMLAMVMLLQGYTKASDAEAVELSVMDRRWQLVLGNLGSAKPLFAQGILTEFRARMVATDMDRRLLEQTVKVARESGAFDHKKIPKTLRVAMDSAPFEGAGRVEDTFNLLGHAGRRIVECVAAMAGTDEAQVALQAGIPLLAQGQSIKAALDIDWHNELEKNRALEKLVGQLDALAGWVKTSMPQLAEMQPLAPYIQALQQVRAQDVEEKDGKVQIRQGVAPDRRISIEDAEMRHGRKSKSKRFNGYKRHVTTDLDRRLILACAVTPANQPEEEAAEAMNGDVEHMKLHIDELSIDLGYMASPLVNLVEARGGEVLCKPWPTRGAQPGMFSKRDFNINIRQGKITCPNGHSEPFEPDETVHFPPEVCGNCPMRSQCTMAAAGRGRSINIAEDEQRQQRLRKAQAAPRGRARNRERTGVEHRLAHLTARQGHRARYRGVRKNLFDVRRAAAIQNLEAVHLELVAAAEAA